MSEKDINLNGVHDIQYALCILHAGIHRFDMLSALYFFTFASTNFVYVDGRSHRQILFSFSSES